MMNVNWIQFAQQIAPWALPLAGGLFLLLAGPFWPKRQAFHFGTALAVVLVSIYLGWRQWQGAEGNAAALILFDKFTYLFVLFFLLALLLTLLLSYDYLESFGLVRPEYYALLLIAVFGMGCMAAGHDLMVVFLGLEIMSVAVYVLAGFRRSNDLCVEAALKYFIIGAFASAFLLLGIAFIYGATGTTNLIVLNKMGMSGLGSASQIFYFIGISLLGVGLAFKIAAVPFHYWAADVYEGAPVIVTTFMATAVKAAGFAALLRVVWAIFQWEPHFLSTVVWTAAALTMTIGNVAALVQRNLKRMLAYSSIAHAGYALVPLAVYAGRGEGAVSAVSFYLLAYILMTTGAFAVLIALTQSYSAKPGLDGSDRERCEMQDLAGLGQQRPFLGFAFTVMMLSLAGIPPTIGFFGKYYLFVEAVKGGAIWLVVIAVLNSVVSVYYYLSPVVAMYFGELIHRKLPYGTRYHMVISVVWLVLLSILFFGLFPSRLLDIVQSLV